MSDVSLGSDWWQASDGKWYAPELHPDHAPATPENEVDLTSSSWTDGSQLAPSDDVFSASPGSAFPSAASDPVFGAGGSNGSDQVFAADGSDQVFGTPAVGSDQVFGTPAVGSDQVFGAPAAVGSDQVFGTPAVGSDQVFGAPAAVGSDQVFGTPAVGSDQVFGATAAVGSDQVFGTPAVGSDQVFGAPQPLAGAQSPSAAQTGYPTIQYPEVAKRATKSKLAAGLLGIFLGWLGIHRFYLGYKKLGITMLLLTLLSLFVLLPVIFIWGLVEGILILADVIKRDAYGDPLK